VKQRVRISRPLASAPLHQIKIEIAGKRLNGLNGTEWRFGKFPLRDCEYRDFTFRRKTIELLPISSREGVAGFDSRVCSYVSDAAKGVLHAENSLDVFQG